MNFNDYQTQANSTAIYPGKGEITGLLYTGLGLGEAGEVQGKIKKVLRDDNGVVTQSKKDDLKKELGDMLWYISQTATELGLTLDEIATTNVAKLQARQEKGTLQGSGDER